MLGQILTGCCIVSTIVVAVSLAIVVVCLVKAEPGPDWWD